MSMESYLPPYTELERSRGLLHASGVLHRRARRVYAQNVQLLVRMTQLLVRLRALSRFRAERY